MGERYIDIDVEKIEEAYTGLHNLEHAYLVVKKADGHRGFPVLEANINQIRTLCYDLLQIAQLQTELDKADRADVKEKYYADLKKRVSSFNAYY